LERAVLCRAPNAAQAAANFRRSQVLVNDRLMLQVTKNASYPVSALAAEGGRVEILLQPKRKAAAEQKKQTVWDKLAPQEVEMTEAAAVAEPTPAEAAATLGRTATGVPPPPPPRQLDASDVSEESDSDGDVEEPVGMRQEAATTEPEVMSKEEAEAARTSMYKSLKGIVGIGPWSIFADASGATANSLVLTMMTQETAHFDGMLQGLAGQLDAIATISNCVPSVMRKGMLEFSQSAEALESFAGAVGAITGASTQPVLDALARARTAATAVPQPPRRASDLEGEHAMSVAGKPEEAEGTAVAPRPISAAVALPAAAAVEPAAYPRAPLGHLGQGVREAWEALGEPLAVVFSHIMQLLCQRAAYLRTPIALSALPVALKAQLCYGHMRQFAGWVLRATLTDKRLHAKDVATELGEAVKRFKLGMMPATHNFFFQDPRLKSFPLLEPRRMFTAYVAKVVQLLEPLLNQASIFLHQEETFLVATNSLRDDHGLFAAFVAACEDAGIAVGAAAAGAPMADEHTGLSEEDVELQCLEAEELLADEERFLEDAAADAAGAVEEERRNSVDAMEEDEHELTAAQMAAWDAEEAYAAPQQPPPPQTQLSLTHEQARFIQYRITLRAAHSIQGEEVRRQNLVATGVKVTLRNSLRMKQTKKENRAQAKAKSAATGAGAKGAAQRGEGAGDNAAPLGSKTLDQHAYERRQLVQAKETKRKMAADKKQAAQVSKAAAAAAKTSEAGGKKARKPTGGKKKADTEEERERVATKAANDENGKHEKAVAEEIARYEAAVTAMALKPNLRQTTKDKAQRVHTSMVEAELERHLAAMTKLQPKQAEGSGEGKIERL
jgi:hypothetical protein